MRSPSFVFELDTAHGLRATAWINRLTGKKLALGNNPELQLDLDASDRRIPITGWRIIDTGYKPCGPDEEHGYGVKAYLPEHDDTSWSGQTTVLLPSQKESGLFDEYRWARTHVFLPRDAEGKAVTLVLGGFGLFDYRYMRVFVNGQEIAVRRTQGRWPEPGQFVLTPKSAGYRCLRFGRENIVALQLSGYVARTKELDAVDPMKLHSLENSFCWPPQFEQYVLIGKHTITPSMKVVKVETISQGAAGECRVHLSSAQPALRATVIYRWKIAEPVLHKFVSIVNKGRSTRRVLNVRLARYVTSAEVSDGDQGFPVYLDGQFFASLAHPSGWAMGENGTVRLRQYPGRALSPGQRLDCMETVLGVAPAGKARQAFLAHVKSRMRRVVRGHDRPYAIFETFGSWPSGDYWGGTEADNLYLVAKMQESEKETGCCFDAFMIELWIDRNGDLERPDPKRFPNGFAPIKRALNRIPYGVWWDTANYWWSITGNPVASDSLNSDRSYGLGDRVIFCEAEGLYEEMLRSAALSHLKSGARVLKFDGNCPICYNPHHGHLAGVYSTEAINDSIIKTLDILDQACPEALLMLYWGHRSPWWLLHADTLFEPGFWIEAASPSDSPSLYARDSVTLVLDQAQAYCADVPPLGKDSLGVWLSNWGFNSSIGKERWQEGTVMDMCRGSLLLQPWSDRDWMTQPERKQFADFAALMRANPKCFANPVRVLGDPWKHEPYGYLCSDGARAFVALNNCTWQNVELPLPAVKGVSGVYQWYPTQAFLGSTTQSPKIALSPFEVVLLELVPAGGKPSLGREFTRNEQSQRFAEPSVDLPVRVEPIAPEKAPSPPVDQDKVQRPKRALLVECTVPATKAGGIVAVTVEMHRNEMVVPVGNVGNLFAAAGTVDGAEVRLAPILGQWTFPSPWQGWRLVLGPDERPRKVQLRVTAVIAADVEVTCRAHFVPAIREAVERQP